MGNRAGPNEVFPKKFIDEKAVSKLTGFSLSTLRKNRFYSKGIPFYKIGKSVRYAVDDVYAYMEKHRVNTQRSK